MIALFICAEAIKAEVIKGEFHIKKSSTSQLKRHLDKGTSGRVWSTRIKNCQNKLACTMKFVIFFTPYNAWETELNLNRT